MKKAYQTPELHIEEYEIENTLGNLCSGVDLPPVHGGDDFE